MVTESEPHCQGGARSDLGCTAFRPSLTVLRSGLDCKSIEGRHPCAASSGAEPALTPPHPPATSTTQEGDAGAPHRVGLNPRHPPARTTPRKEAPRAPHRMGL